MKAIEIRNKYLEFFKRNGHKQIDTAPLVIEDDDSVLFTTAGMQPLVPYLMGKPHPMGKRLTDYQKCVRTNDIDEVGDNRHLTYFEMLGNWSLGDYFKEESVKMSYEFLTKELNIPKERLYVTCFKGDDDCARDEETAKVWEEAGLAKDHIYFYPKEENWWIAGETGPCGPDTEMFYDTGKEKCCDDCQPSCDCGKYVEIWNNVFMEFYKDEEGNYTKLKQRNVDTGMGLERITFLLQGKETPFDTEIFSPVMDYLEKEASYDSIESRRIAAEHLRTSMMIINDGVYPSNVDRGYILRRLIRRMIRNLNILGISLDKLPELITLNINALEELYPELKHNEEKIKLVIIKEKDKFIKTLERGEKEFDKLIKKLEKTNPNMIKLDSKEVFNLYETYGVPTEITVELANKKGYEVDLEEIDKLFKAHQEKSRSNLKQKFKGGLAGTSDVEVRYHTASHLLNAALKEVIDKNIHQRGSNITPERMRFDFNCNHKLTDEEKKAVEDLVNKWIESGLEVKREEMKKEDAINSGAECMFIEKYPDVVNVYTVGDGVSKELCNGPHVKNTKEIGKFKIIKEESCGSGLRRIRAVIE